MVGRKFGPLFYMFPILVIACNEDKPFLRETYLLDDAYSVTQVNEMARVVKMLAVHFGDPNLLCAAKTWNC